MKKIVMAMAVGVIALAAWGAAGGLEELRGLVLAHAKLPVYNKQTLRSWSSATSSNGRAG